MAGFNTLARLLTFGHAVKPPRPDGVIAPPPAGTRRRPVGAPIVGTATTRDKLAGEQVKATNPPDAVAGESAAVAAARLAAARTRRRATAGTLFPGGKPSPSQAGVSAGGNTARLLGY